MNKYIYVVFSLLFIIFLIIFFSSKSNFIEYSNYKKTVYTEKQIKKFEKDIKEGKNVNINDYIENETKDYSNNVTEFGDFVSKNLFKSIAFVFKETYKFLEKLIG